MFHHAPSEAFEPEPDACSDLIMESIQVVSAEEDLAQATDIFVTLGDFGTGKLLNNDLLEHI